MSASRFMRDEFSEATKRVLAARVGYRCSRCRAWTTGPQVDDSKSVNVGVAAHITAASQGGARYDADLDTISRSSAANGIWLCQTCAKLVDNDAARFPAELLRSWKSDAEERALSSIGRATSSNESSVAHPLPSFDRLTDLIVLMIPVVTLVALLFRIEGPTNLIVVRAYALFLVSYHAYVLGYEYYLFPALHRNKVRPVDTLLISGMFASLYQFNEQAPDLSRCILALLSFLALLITWEIYTISRGYSGYFQAVPPLPERSAHWREYKYWLVLDISLLLALGAGWLLRHHLMRVATPVQILSAGALVGLAVGAVNVYRYQVIHRRTRRSVMPPA